MHLKLGFSIVGIGSHLSAKDHNRDAAPVASTGQSGSHAQATHVFDIGLQSAGKGQERGSS
jgi:hypothetical protein